jgi:hypothetical protein
MTTDERIKALVEILKIVAWPAVVVWLFWCFRDAVNRAFTRITEIGLTALNLHQSNKPLHCRRAVSP